MSAPTSSTADPTLFPSLGQFLQSLPPLAHRLTNEIEPFLAQFEKAVGPVPLKAIIDIAECALTTNVDEAVIQTPLLMEVHIQHTLDCIAEVEARKRGNAGGKMGTEAPSQMPPQNALAATVARGARPHIVAARAGGMEGQAKAGGVRARSTVPLVVAAPSRRSLSTQQTSGPCFGSTTPLNGNSSFHFRYPSAPIPSTPFLTPTALSLAPLPTILSSGTFGDATNSAVLAGMSTEPFEYEVEGGIDPMGFEDEVPKQSEPPRKRQRTAKEKKPMQECPYCDQKRANLIQHFNANKKCRYKHLLYLRSNAPEPGTSETRVETNEVAPVALQYFTPSPSFAGAPPYSVVHNATAATTSSLPTTRLPLSNSGAFNAFMSMSSATEAHFGADTVDPRNLTRVPHQNIYN